MFSRRRWLSFVLAGLAAIGSWSALVVAADDDGWQTIFDGKTLDGWDGNPDFWRVEEGTITGQTTADKPTKGNTFIIWRKGETADFELKLEYKIVGGNSGIQYRSFEVPNEKWVIGGYQGDFEAGDTYSGILYGERFRGILCNRGQKTVLKKKDGKFAAEVVGSVGDTKEIQAKIKKEDWNSYRIVAKGFHFQHFINDVATADCTDEDDARREKGVLALQLHAGPPMKVQFRNIKIKQAKSKDSASGAAGEDKVSSAKKKALLLAGNPSHGFGAHDHLSGCSLLAKLLNESGLVEAKVHSLKNDGWPKPEAIEAANTIVIYSDGGGGHPFNGHLEELSARTAKGTGIVCIHYGVETTVGKPGQAFLDWTGGFFEPHWSVNPHWTAYYKQLPKHPTTNGVKSFSTNDEWYYHMRFREKMEGVTPILTDLPPKESLSRGDGPHSGNPAVRKAVLEDKEPQHMAWATQRADGGRGFGCSGGHVHWNWGNTQFRKLILNAIVWTSGTDVPADGVPAGKVTVDDLLKDHDEPIPADFNEKQRPRIQAMLDEWNAQATK
ncbi:MAG: family 16 glycoside hydrolase [Planctomycetaceae bacterium]